MGVYRGSPLGSRGAGVVFVAAAADFRALGRAQRLETPHQPRFLAAGVHVLAARAVAGFAGFALADAMMDVLLERLDVGIRGNWHTPRHRPRIPRPR